MGVELPTVGKFPKVHPHSSEKGAPLKFNTPLLWREIIKGPHNPKFR